MTPTPSFVSTKQSYATDGSGARMMHDRIRRAAIAAAVVGLLATVTAAQPAAGGTHAAHPAVRVTVDDIRVPVPGQHPVAAYLVKPAGNLAADSHAGILFLHWLGQIHSDRTEFLAEAVQLARRGAVSLLPQGTFPWRVAPTGTARDVTA